MSDNWHSSLLGLEDCLFINDSFISALERAMQSHLLFSVRHTQNPRIRIWVTFSLAFRIQRKEPILYD